MPFSPERTALIKARIQGRLSAGPASEWELSFLKSMEKRFDRYGSKTRLSDAQYSRLRKILDLGSLESSPGSVPATTQNESAVARKRPIVQLSSQRSSTYKWRRPKSPLSSAINTLTAPKRAVRRLERRLFLPAILMLGFLAIVGTLWETGPVSQQADKITYLIVTGGSVNQREGPTIADNVMGQLSKGTQVRRLNDEGGWSHIVSPLGTGWMSSEFLTLKQPSGTLHQVNTPFGNVSSQPLQDVRSLKARSIRVIDGDTVTISGERANVRLVGFNTPETRSPSCSAELAVGRKATARLKRLIKGAQSIEFRRVACACRPGTEGTKQCNFGRECGFLAVDGTDVGTILIQERLAVPYRCGKISCPPRPGSWCE